MWNVGAQISCDYQNVILPFAAGWDVMRMFNMLKHMAGDKEAAAYNFMDEDEMPSPTSLAIEHAPSVKYGLAVECVRGRIERVAFACFFSFAVSFSYVSSARKSKEDSSSTAAAGSSAQSDRQSSSRRPPPPFV